MTKTSKPQSMELRPIPVDRADALKMALLMERKQRAISEFDSFVAALAARYLVDPSLYTFNFASDDDGQFVPRPPPQNNGANGHKPSP